MKIIGVIPARYKSTRFEGKPLADICGKPMIWWVYNQVRKSTKLQDVYVATDNERIASICQKMSMNFIMTQSTHCTSTERLNEVAHKIDADFYVCINGDEPLVDPNLIDIIIPNESHKSEIYVANLMTEIKNPVEAIDFTNIKVVTDIDSFALFMSRNPIPYPKASINYKYYKHVGILIYNLKSLEFFANTSMGYNESIEDINELRFIEHGQKLKMIAVETDTLSVDTPKDLEKVRLIIAERIKRGDIIMDRFTPPPLNY
jgi:3-deoxy-manno-octulosonate cytidylyltransferase (CMP-KDO synthetase)